MNTLLLTNEEIIALGFKGKRLILAVKDFASDHFIDQQKEYAINLLKDIYTYPTRFTKNDAYKVIVKLLLNENEMEKVNQIYKKTKLGERAPLIIELPIGKPFR